MTSVSQCSILPSVKRHCKLPENESVQQRYLCKCQTWTFHFSTYLQIQNAEWAEIDISTVTGDSHLFVIGLQPACLFAEGIQKFICRWDKCLNEFERHAENETLNLTFKQFIFLLTNTSWQNTALTECSLCTCKNVSIFLAQTSYVQNIFRKWRELPYVDMHISTACCCGNELHTAIDLFVSYRHILFVLFWHQTSLNY